MSHPIKRDHVRFKKVVKGRLKENLQKYVSRGEMPVPKGNGIFRIPMPSIETPHFKFGEKQQGGVGHGEGKPEEALNELPGAGSVGSGAGKKELDVELTLEELAAILGEKLELPRIEPKGRKSLQTFSDKYSGISTVGPDSLRHFKRSFKEALKRQVSIGIYDENNPIIIPIKRDFRYRNPLVKPEYQNSAVVIYMMDVSGSMGDEQKEIVRTESFWINLWLKSQYKDIEIRYIIHDATAKEVDESTFFRTRESGGTLISSALKLCKKLIEEEYNSEEWNIYPFHFSDGDNWSTDDTKLCLEILEKDIIPKANVFCYGQVESKYGSGQFYKDLFNKYGANNPSIILSKIKNKEAILGSIRDFLGKGK